MTRSTRRNERRGFVLLVTLALVLLAGALLSGLALRSASAAVDSRSATERLQRRWAVISCRQTLLPLAEQVLTVEMREHSRRRAHDDEFVLPPAESRVQCRLAGLDYDLVFTDEQAKINVNMLLKSQTNESTRRDIQHLLGNISSPTDIRLRYRRFDDQTVGSMFAPQGVGGFGQIFQTVSPSELVGDQPGEGWAGHLTCWSDERVNMVRASNEVLRLACEKILSRAQINQLLRARQTARDRSATSVLNSLTRDISSKDMEKLRAVLIDQSACHGLWVIQRSKQRSWYTLIVGNGMPGSADPLTGLPGSLANLEIHTFQW